MEVYQQYLKQHQEYQQQVWQAHALEQQQQELFKQQLLQQAQQQQAYHTATPMASAPSPSSTGAVPGINPPPVPEAKANPENVRKSSGWLERCVAFAMAYDQGLWSTCDPLTKIFMQSTDFTHRFNSHWETIKRWGKDSRYDFK